MVISPLIIPPRPALLPWIHHIIVMGYQDASVSPIPAVLSPNIIVFPRGSGCLEAPDGTLTPLPRASLKGPCLEPRKVLCSARSCFVSILFRAGLGAQALGPAVREFRDRVISLENMVSPRKLALILEQMDETTELGAWAKLAQDLLLDCLWSGRDSRSMGIPLGTLFKPVRTIATELGISVRQVERRMDQAYVANLRDVRRMARFGYCFAKLTTDSPCRGRLARIAQDYGYYDQSHMDRDFKTFAGYSPGALLEAATSNDPGLWLYRLDKRNFQDVFLANDVDSVQESFFNRA